MKRLNLNRQFVLKGFLLLAMVSQISMDRVARTISDSGFVAGESSSADFASTAPKQVAPGCTEQNTVVTGNGKLACEEGLLERIGRTFSRDTSGPNPSLNSSTTRLSFVHVTDLRANSGQADLAQTGTCPGRDPKETDAQRDSRLRCENLIEGAKKLVLTAPSCTVVANETVDAKKAREAKCAEETKENAKLNPENAIQVFAVANQNCPALPADLEKEKATDKQARETCEKAKREATEQLKKMESLIASQDRMEAGCGKECELRKKMEEQQKTIEKLQKTGAELEAKLNAQTQSAAGTTQAGTTSNGTANGDKSEAKGAAANPPAPGAAPAAETQEQQKTRLAKEEEERKKKEEERVAAEKERKLKVFQCEVKADGSELGERAKADCALDRIKKLGSFKYDNKATKKSDQLADVKLFHGILKAYLKEQLKSNDAGTRESAKSILTKARDAIESIASSQDLTRATTDKMVRELEGMEKGAEVYATALAMKEETSDLRTRLADAQREVRTACKQETFISIRIYQSKNAECMSAVRDYQALSVERATAQSTLLQDLTFGTYSQTLAEMRKGGLTRAEFKEWTQPYLSLSRDLGLSDTGYGGLGTNRGIADGLLSASLNSRLSDFEGLPNDFLRYRGLGNEFSYDRSGNFNLSGLRRGAFQNPNDSLYDRGTNRSTGNRFGTFSNGLNQNMNGSIMNRGPRANNWSGNNRNSNNNRSFNNRNFNNNLNNNNNRWGRSTTFGNDTFSSDPFLNGGRNSTTRFRN